MRIATSSRLGSSHRLPLLVRHISLLIIIPHGRGWRLQLRVLLGVQMRSPAILELLEAQQGCFDLFLLAALPPV